MTNVRVARGCFVVVLSCAIVAGTALRGRAQANVERCKQLYYEGEERRAAGDVDAACTKFRQAYDCHDRSPTAELELARCDERRHAYADAWTHYKDAGRRFSQPVDGSNSEQREAARNECELGAERVRAMRSGLKIILEPAPEALQGLTVLLDEKPLDAQVVLTGWSVNSGQHVLKVLAHGFVASVSTFTSIERESLAISVQLQPEPPPATPQPPPPPSPSPSPPPPTGDSGDSGAGHASRGRVQPTAGWVLIGIGAAAEIVAIVLGGLTLGKVKSSNPYCTHPGRTCDDTGLSYRREAANLQTIGIVTAAAGAASAGVGLTLILTAPSTSGSARSAALVWQGHL